MACVTASKPEGWSGVRAGSYLPFARERALLRLRSMRSRRGEAYAALDVVDFHTRVSVISTLRRMKRMPLPDRMLLIEAAGALTFASLAIGLLPFRKIVSFAEAAGSSRHRPSEAATEIARVRWATEACARHLPWRIVCFQKGLALHKLLRRRGIATCLHYGVAQDRQRGLTAHVWVTHEGEAVIGGEEAAGYTCLASYPAAAQP